LEVFDVALEEVELAGVEVLEEALEQAFGDLVIDLRLDQVAAVQELADHLDHQAVLLAGDRLGRGPRRQEQQAEKGRQQGQGTLRVGQLSHDEGTSHCRSRTGRVGCVENRYGPRLPGAASSSWGML